MIKKHPHITAVFIFLFTAIILTWPLTLHITKQFPSTLYDYGGDPDMYMWYMHGLAAEIASKLPVGLNQMIFYPQGMNLAAGYEGILMLPVGVPIILLTQNPILAYNIILLLAFVATALACYYLILYLTDSYFSALITGFSFGFSPFMLVRGTQHIDLMFLFVVPMLVLTAIKFVRNPGNKTIFWLALVVLVTALAAWYYLVAGMIFLGLMFLFNWRQFLDHKKIYVFAGVAVLIAVLIPAIPLFVHKSNTQLSIADQTVNNAGAQPLNFILPHPFMNLWQNVTTKYYVKFPSVYSQPYPYFEATSYFGLVGLLALITLIFLRKKIKVPYEWLWVTTLIVFTVLAMGNYVKIGHWTIAMPFALLHKIFPFDRLRAPNRFFVFAYMAVTIIFGYLVASLPKALPRIQSLVLVTMILLALLLAERIIYPYPLTAIPVPQFYKDLSTQTGNFAIADVPITNPGYSFYDYYQIYHNKPIVDGEFFWTGYNNNTFDFVKANQLLKNLASCHPDLTAMDQVDDLNQLALAGVRYVVVHDVVLATDKDCPQTAIYAHEFFKNIKPVFADGEISVYQTQTK